MKKMGAKLVRESLNEYYREGEYDEDDYDNDEAEAENDYIMDVNSVLTNKYGMDIDALEAENDLYSEIIDSFHKDHEPEEAAHWVMQSLR